MENHKYDLIIMVTKPNIELLKRSISYINKNINAQHISFVANANLKQELIQFRDVMFIDENNMLPELSLEAIKIYLEKLCGDGRRAGWYYQQFLKMSYAYICPHDYYAVWDSDTIPLNTIDYFITEGKATFIYKKEYHMPYFNTISKLFNGEVRRYRDDVSFIAENMIINKNIMLELIERIESNTRLQGDNFYERILYAIDIENITSSGFSEYETYGNFVMRYYPKKYSLVKMRTFRIGALLIGAHPTLEQLKWMSDSFDIISIEHHCPEWMSFLSRLAICRKLIKATYFAKIGMALIKFVYGTLLRRQLIEYD